MFRHAVHTGKKRFTLRKYKIANHGEIVSTNFGPIEINAVTKQTPRWVGEHLYEVEGFQSPEQFFQTWAQMHPDLSLDKPLWLHEFTYLPLRYANQRWC